MATSRIISSTLIHGGTTLPPQYLTGMDVMLNHNGNPVVLVYPGGLDANAMQASLAKAVAAYPVIAGRLKRDAHRQIYIDSQDQGVRFLVKAHDTPLPAYGIDHPLDADMRRFASRVFPWQVVDRDQALFTIELHQFSCGGALLSLVGIHSVCDGAAFWAFVLDWARAHAGGAIAPPALDRNAVIQFSQAQTHRPYTQNFLITTTRLQRLPLYARFAWQYFKDYGKVAFRVSTEQLNQWKDEARQRQPEGDALASHELVTAYCMQKLSSRMRSPSPRYIGAVTDMRFRRGLCFGRKYVGNALGQDRLVLSAQELSQDDLGTLARKCRIPLEGVSQDDLLSFLGLMERHRQQHTIGDLAFESAIESLDNGVVLNNCVHFPIYKLDFGRGAPSWCDNERAAFRKLMLAPTPGMDGAIDVHLSAPLAELAAFNEA